MKDKSKVIQKGKTVSDESQHKLGDSFRLVKSKGQSQKPIPYRKTTQTISNPTTLD